MKFLLPPLLVLLSANAATVDPFESASGASWTKTLEQEKPYHLVIACGETKSPPPQDPEKPCSGAGGFIVTKEFMDVAKVTTVAVAANDAGALIREDGVEMQYRLKHEKDNFLLSLHLTAKAGGTREINTEITIPSGAWQVIALMTREESVKLQSGKTTTERRYYSVAVKLELTETPRP